MSQKVRFLETDWIYQYTDRPGMSSGSAQALPMTEEEVERVRAKQTIPFGFVAPELPKRKSRRKTAQGGRA